MLGFIPRCMTFGRFSRVSVEYVQWLLCSLMFKNKRSKRSSCFLIFPDSYWEQFTFRHARLPDATAHSLRERRVSHQAWGALLFPLLAALRASLSVNFLKITKCEISMLSLVIFCFLDLSPIDGYYWSLQLYKWICLFLLSVLSVFVSIFPTLLLRWLLI